jgi:hypothetical protein
MAFTHSKCVKDVFVSLFNLSSSFSALPWVHHSNLPFYQLDMKPIRKNFSSLPLSYICDSHYFSFPKPGFCQLQHPNNSNRDTAFNLTWSWYLVNNILQWSRKRRRNDGPHPKLVQAKQHGLGAMTDHCLLCECRLQMVTLTGHLAPRRSICTMDSCITHHINHWWWHKKSQNIGYKHHRYFVNHVGMYTNLFGPLFLFTLNQNWNILGNVIKTPSSNFIITCFHG